MLTLFELVLCIIKTGIIIDFFAFSMNTSETGTYSRVYDANTEKWSTDAIGMVKANLDYDGIPYPSGHGKSVTITIQSYDKKSKHVDWTLEAIVVKEDSTDTRNIKMDAHDLDLNWE